MLDVARTRAQVLRRLLAATAVMLVGMGTARADTVVFAGSGLIGGTQTVVTPLSIPAAGTLTVTLSDLAWPTRLNSLSFALTDSTTVLGRMTAPGTQRFTVGGAANLFAHVYGSTNSALDLGLYSLRVQFTPVPLPSAAVLLLAGVGLFAAMRDRRLRSLSPRMQPT